VEEERLVSLRVHIICKNWREDRIIPRMARALAERLGWSLGSVFQECDALYLSAYFEGQGLDKNGAWPPVPVAAYFSHREEEPPKNAKARVYDAMAKRVDLRVATCAMYARGLQAYGPTIQAAAPLETEHFTLARRKPNPKRVIGFSGFTYPNKRKGEDLVKGILESPLARHCEFRACGRGWPVATQKLPWAKMPGFYQGIDVLVVPSRVEGIPMPPLEALACGTPVVIPRGVGLHDELPDVPGIYRYEKGDLASLLEALGQAIRPEGPVVREQLREAVQAYSVENWVRDVGQGVMAMLEPPLDAGLTEETEGPDTDAESEIVIEEIAPVERKTGSARGIYCVAFGDPARGCALRLMQSIKKHMPDIPICLCAERKIGPEDVLIVQPDSDVGGRRAKLKAYDLAPAEWQAVLYLDADTEVVAPIYRYFEWIEDGWEFVICKDPHLMDTMHNFKRANNAAEVDDLRKKIKTLHTLQYNGGVWAFARNERVAAFFQRWQMEWEKFAQRDQGALIRAMYADPLKVLVLGNQWNTFDKYSRGVQTAGLMHYPGDARRWEGLIPGRIDSPAAWEAVKRYEKIHRRRR